MNSLPACRLCGEDLTETFVDLGMSPLCESYVPRAQLDAAETFYPLHVRVCSSCLLVQLPAYVSGEEIFSDYAYFSSYSDSWVAHAKRYADAMTDRLGLTPDSLVVEVASNDGYLLQHFVARGIPVLGVEPAANVAEAARARGITTVVEFMGAETGPAIAAEHGHADLVAANNVFAHVPDIRGFAAGLRALVKDSGLVTLEFPHLLRLIERRQYDTIYHEHYSYLSLLTASRALGTAGLRVVDVDELATHGGSLRVYATPEESAGEPSLRVKEVLDEEERAGLHTLAGHAGFSRAVMKIKRDLVGFLLDAAAEGLTVAGYGAPGQRQHAPQPLRHPFGPRLVHRRPQPAQAGDVPARNAHSDPRAGDARRDQARLRPRPAVEPAGRDQRTARVRPLVGRPAGVSHSRARHRLRGA